MAATAFDIAIVGGGLAGLTTALVLASRTPSNCKIALVAPEAEIADGRTTALLANSVDILAAAGIWSRCVEITAALSTMRIIDGTNRLIRAPVVNFRSGELGLEAFGYNIANAEMAEWLKSMIAETSKITRFEQMVDHSEEVDDQRLVRLADKQEISARLVIAADGRNSKMRQAAGISSTNWSYPQWALVLNLTHSLPHGNCSTEFHTETGPFTLVPLPAHRGGTNRSSLVWVETHPEAERLRDLKPGELAAAIETRMQSMLGKIAIDSKPQIFPLSGMRAKEFGARRVALVADAAHVFPPIGAQGFNLGLRDIDALATLVSRALARSEDPGSPQLLQSYNRSRGSDVSARTMAVDLLNRSLLASFLPIQALRAGGLFALSKLPWLRQFAMRQGLGGRSRPITRETDHAAAGLGK